MPLFSHPSASSRQNQVTTSGVPVAMLKACANWYILYPVLVLGAIGAWQLISAIAAGTKRRSIGAAVDELID